eukprot:TRINITY_DN1935_c0_g1_i1.p1 TRINITY_DN1935_c0_g1~~TRINITY_DN1935_c0_g1_i1.p1  ORF type:complete len:442 (+),score=82.78 TRINITY_DN1935_c0_g1_i1:155-1327(+)
MDVASTGPLNGLSLRNSGSNIPLVNVEDIQRLQKRAPARGLSLENTLSVGVFETVGKRPEMEDRHEVITFSNSNSSSEANSPQTSLRNSNLHPSTHTNDFASTSPSNNSATTSHSEDGTNWAFFAIYDGHGGTECADFVQAHLHENIVNHPAFTTDTELAIREGVLKTDGEYLEHASRGNSDGLVGTTACFVLVQKNALYVGNVGDSAAILFRKNQIVSLTNAHTPKNQQERERIEREGGIIVDGRLGHPVWNPTLINLAVTRALGNLYFKGDAFVGHKQSGLISEPEIVKVDLTCEDKFVLLASDGFWDVISPQEACSYILKNRNRHPTIVCKELTEFALRRATFDNTTVMLINLGGTTHVNGDNNSGGGKGEGILSSPQPQVERRDAT